MKRFLIIALSFISVCCDEISDDPHDRQFNIQFKYGVGAGNELNTFENTYTKNLLLDGTITVKYVLPLHDLYAIEGKFQRLNLFSYPDTFAVVSTDSNDWHGTIYQTYFIRIKTLRGTKTLFWADSVQPRFQPDKYRALSETVQFIVDMLAWKPEIRNLPPARAF